MPVKKKTAKKKVAKKKSAKKVVRKRKVAKKVASDTPPISEVFLLTHEFMTREEVEVYLRERNALSNVTLLETLLAYCEERDIDTASVGVLISQTLKKDMEVEARRLNLLKQE